MRKKIIGIIAFIFIILIILYFFTPIFEPLKKVLDHNTIYVSDNGWLKVDGTKIKNKNDEIFTLKGLSSHGIQWCSDILTYDNLKHLKETWNINTFRIAMYTWQNGYISNKEEIKNKVIDIANMVIDLDMYVIIDWHTLFDNNPNTYLAESKEFFNEISNLYKDKPNVIYEICNEPNGNSVDWDNDVKPYAEEVIPIIRSNSPDSLIIVGTPSWCQKLEPAANNPLDFDNILYSCHFYAGTQKQELRDEINKCLEKDLPIFVSEWGTTAFTGDGDIDEEETKIWINFLNERNISFINWSFSCVEEKASILTPNYLEDFKNEQNFKNNTLDFNNYLTDSGKLVKSLL